MATLNPAQVEKHLKGVNYPINKAELVKHMERNGADESVREVISSLPNQSYDSPAAVNRAISALQGNQGGNQGSMHQDRDHDHSHDDQNRQDQSQQGKQKANR